MTPEDAMSLSPQAGRRRVVDNPLHAPAAVAGLEHSSRAYHRSLPGYAVTPLRAAPSAAERLGVAAVWVKDESERIGTPSFKILGASWATCRVLVAWMRETGGGAGPEASAGSVPEASAGSGGAAAAAPVLTFDELRTQLAAHIEATGRRPSLAAATDGNHGRAVAIMARLLGLPARIFVPADMVAARIAALESEGADVEVVAGGYDDAIRRSAEIAGPDVLVVSDTSWEGYTEPPAWVIDGYSTMMSEIREAIAAGELPAPTVVAAQIGVGAFAAAVARGFAGSAVSPGSAGGIRDAEGSGDAEGTGPEASAGEAGPARLIGVEPTLADCVSVSVERGELTEIPGPQTSIMAGLNCGTPSQIAWPDVTGGFDAFAVVTDDDAREAMRLLAADGIVSGESGAASLAGLLAHGEELGLGAEDVVLVFSTEGATDEDAYREIVGQS